MVTNISKEELERYVRADACIIAIELKDRTVREWKEKGYFRFIKSQLENVHDLMFACIRTDDACSYYFVCPTWQLKNRIENMLYKLVGGKMVSIVRCSSKVGCGGGVDRVETDGEGVVCNLF